MDKVHAAKPHYLTLIPGLPMAEPTPASCLLAYTHMP